MCITKCLHEIHYHGNYAATGGRFPTNYPSKLEGFYPRSKMMDHLLYARMEWERLPD